MRRRIYTVDGKEVDSANVGGILHTARKDLYECLDCNKPVLKGQQYIEWNAPFHQGWMWHLPCYLQSHGGNSEYPKYVVIKIEKRYATNFRLYLNKKPHYTGEKPRTECICKSIKELTVQLEGSGKMDGVKE